MYTSDDFNKKVKDAFEKIRKEEYTNNLFDNCFVEKDSIKDSFNQICDVGCVSFVLTDTNSISIIDFCKNHNIPFWSFSELSKNPYFDQNRMNDAKSLLGFNLDFKEVNYFSRHDIPL